MPSAIQRRSFGSLVIYSVDRILIQRALDDYVKKLQQRPEVEAVVLLGSFNTDRFGVGSDVDLLVVVRDTPVPFLDRSAHYRPEEFPVDIDVFVYTVEEVRRGQPLARTALEGGTMLWSREGMDVKALIAG